MNRRSQNISNLHSLLAGKWLITDSSANGLMPDLARLLQGADPIETKAELPYFYSSIEKKFYYYDDEDDDYYDDDHEEIPTRKSSIAVLPVKGAILKYSQFCGPMGTKQMSAYLDAWEKNDDIDGVLLDIDSGGGQASGTPEFAARIKAFTKPIVVYSDGMICSAAYWIAAATDYIVVNEYCDDIGSIGTMAKGVLIDGIIEKQGGKIIEEYASKSTEKNHTSRELKKGNSKPFIEFDLDPINDRFHDMMRAYRPQLDESVFTGVSYILSKDALEKNLVDEIGSRQTALDKITELISLKESEQNTNSNIDNNMSNTGNFAALAAVLGVAAIETKKGLFDKEAKANFSLTEAQLNDLDTVCAKPDASALESQVTELQALLTEANSAKEAATASLTALEMAVSTAMTTNNLEMKSTALENIAELSAKTVEFGKKKDTKPTNVNSPQEVVNDTEEVFYESLQKQDLTGI